MRLAVLGGGQLARFLVEAGKKQGSEPVPLVSVWQEPAAQAARQAALGSIQDEAFLKTFLADKNVVLFENEFVPTELLQSASRSLPTPPRFTPSLEAVARVRNKLFQKKLLQDLGIATSPFYAWDGKLAEEKFLQEALKRLGGRAVLKWSLYGYDGHGTFFWEPRTPLEKARAFLAEGRKKGTEIYAESWVNFKKEWALVSTAGLDARQLVHYPLVESQQDQGICLWVWGPAPQRIETTLAHRFQEEAQKAARLLAQSLPLSGTFAIEFFQTENDELWVNEIAPRVHNSGHFSLDAASESQFELHLHAARGENLAPPTTAPFFVMLNLLGPPGENYRLPEAREQDRWARELSGLNLRCHLYGKAESRPRRKLGHVTAWFSPGEGDSFAQLEARCQAVAGLWRERLAQCPRLC